MSYNPEYDSKPSECPQGADEQIGDQGIANIPTSDQKTALLIIVGSRNVLSQIIIGYIDALDTAVTFSSEIMALYSARETKWQHRVCWA